MTKTNFNIFGRGASKYSIFNSSSDYKYVRKCERIVDGHVFWQSDVLGVSKFTSTEREAALWVDKRLIEKGKEPVNILKRV